MNGPELDARMERLGIREDDIVEKFVRSQGPGGQNVNKTSTCVYLKHIPTGIEVKCGLQRSQAQNRETARGLLVEKIERKLRAEAAALRSRREKERRRLRRRSARAKARMLEDKKRHGRKKSLRAQVREF